MGKRKKIYKKYKKKQKQKEKKKFTMKEKKKKEKALSRFPSKQSKIYLAVSVLFLMCAMLRALQY